MLKRKLVVWALLLLLPVLLLGCVEEDEECVGIQKQCHTIENESDCQQQSGCEWVDFYDSTYCEGNAAFCDDFDEEDACLDQLGCEWE